MTIVSAWIKNNNGSEQMIVASDSRLTFGATWDCCAKIFPLKRNDSVLAFCGDTLYAYPVLIQLMNSIGNYEKTLSREMDITDLRGHLLKIMNAMNLWVTEKPKGNHCIDPTDYSIMFAGYSHKLKKFMAWNLLFDDSSNKFIFRPLSFHRGRTNGTKAFLFIGDNVKDAMKRLYEKLRAKNLLTEGGLEMEPLEVIADIIKEGKCRSIGGPPQMVKIYSYSNVLPVNFLWPFDDPKYITHFGRPLLPYEGTRYGTYDFDSGELISPVKAYARLLPK